jgi:hypothetical protein
MLKIDINFVEGEKAIEILLNSDNYYQIMTPNERALRMGIDHDPDKPISEEEFGNYVKQHICEFKSSDKRIITDIIDKITKCLQDNNFVGYFPETVNIILTDGQEDIRECAGYCRKNTICINKRGLRNDPLSLFAHELFHIFSQNNPGLRNKLYKSIGFKKCNDIVLPTDLIPKLITNPDAQLHDVYINVKLKKEKKLKKRKLSQTHSERKYEEVKSKEVKCKEVKCKEIKCKEIKCEEVKSEEIKCDEIKVTPVLFYDKDNGVSFFQKLYIRLLRIEPKNRNKTSDDSIDHKLPQIEYVYYVNDEKQYEMYTVDEVDNFWSQVGDCRYYFHPDEILATRFASHVVNNILYGSWHISPWSVREEREKEMIELLFNRSFKNQ